MMQTGKGSVCDDVLKEDLGGYITVNVKANT